METAGHAHKPLREDARSVRLFLLKAALFVSVWGALFFKGQWVRYGYWEVTWAVALGIGLLFPAPFRPVRRAMVRLGSAIGHSLAWLALALIYWIGIAPLGLLARLAGKSFMPKSKDPAATSYWEKRPAEAMDKSSLERQY